MTATEPAKAAPVTKPAWSGINHLALITPDMDATVRFYHGVLGAELVATVGTPDFRHYFFEFGPQCTVAFFEYAGQDIEPLTKPAGIPDPRAPQFDHLSLNLPDEAALHGLRQRLLDAKCEVTEIVDHGFIRSVYFTDPNGIALEASWWVHDVTDHTGPDGEGIFGDKQPVAALQEILATGDVATTGEGTTLT